MDAKSQAVLDAALNLDDADRVVIVQQLLQSLSPDAEEPSEEELARELDRRLVEFQQDPTAGVPWSALKQES